MYYFRLKPTAKSVKWFNENGYDVKAMSAALSMIFSDVEPNTITRKIDLTIQIVEGSDKSTFIFYTNKLQLCDRPDENAKSQKQKDLALFEHLLHEFRHWMQNRVYKISHTEFNYSDEDADNNRNAYFRNEHEVDARRFSKQHLKNFCKYYKAYKR
jgi:hypothetical protein